MQRPDQPHRDAPAQLRRVRPGHAAASPGGRRNQLTAGGGVRPQPRRLPRSPPQLGYLNPDRSVTGVDAFGDGVDRRERRRRAVRHARRSRRAISTPGASMRPTRCRSADAWHVTLSGALQPHQQSATRDRIRARRRPARSTATTRSAGSIRPPASRSARRASVNVYAGYSEGSRAPTSIELGCADPEQPCKLPNAMAGDPPLNQVVTRTLEAGCAADGSNAGTNWNVGLFRAENRDDILFVSSTADRLRLFQELRQHAAAGRRARPAAAASDRVSVGAGYTFLEATFRATRRSTATSNSTNDAAAAGARGSRARSRSSPAIGFR